MIKKICVLLLPMLLLCFTACATQKQKRWTGDGHDNDSDDYSKKSLLFKETKEFLLNNKNHEITFRYYLVTYSDHYLTVYSDTDKEVKWTALRVFLKDQKIYEINNQVHIGLNNFEGYDGFSKNATENEIIALIKKKNPYGIKDNFTKITGDDGIDYLIFTIVNTADNHFHTDINFINDKGEILHVEMISHCSFWVFKDNITDANYMRGKEKTPFYVKDNKLYSLEMECPWSSDSGPPFTCKIFEKTLTINQNKVSEKKKEIRTIRVNDHYCY